MKVETLAQFKQTAENMFKDNQNTRYFMKYRDDNVTITLKVTDGTKTYTYDVVDRKEDEIKSKQSEIDDQLKQLPEINQTISYLETSLNEINKNITIFNIICLFVSF